LDYDWLVAVPLWYFVLSEKGVWPNWKYGINSPPIVLKPPTSVTTVTEPQPTCTSAPASTITTSSKSTPSLSSGAKAGIAIGSVAAACSIFALGFLFASLKSKKKGDTDEIARPPTLSLRRPPTLPSQQNVDKLSLRSGHPAQPASAGLELADEEDATIRRLNLTPGASSLDGTTLRPPIEMPER